MEHLIKEYRSLTDELKKINSAVESEKRGFSDAENSRLAEINKRLESLTRDIDAVKAGNAAINRADEFERARKPIIEGIRKSQQTNEYWLSSLSVAQRDPRELESIRVAISGFEAVTPAAVQQAAQKWLKDDNAWHLVILPEAGH